MQPASEWINDRTHGTIEHPDALLIAAAPDLLAALIPLYRHFSQIGNPDMLLVEDARKAIEKATQA